MFILQKKHRILAKCLLLILLGTSEYSYANELPTVFNSIDEKLQGSLLTLSSDTDKNPDHYQVFVHSDKIRNLIKNKYYKKQMENIFKNTETTRKISLSKRKWGTFIEATTFSDSSMANETHYNAIWVRDSLWGYLAINSENGFNDDAKNILLTTWDYFSSHQQIDRIDKIIKNPKLINDVNSQMLVPHIRFDGNSETFEDVKESINGVSQNWNHKQNDALGLFVDCLLDAISNNYISKDDWTKNNRIEALARLIQYFSKVKFYDMPDSGAWEEDERLNTSSVALVTSSLEKLQQMMLNNTSKNAKLFTSELRKKFELLGYDIKPNNINELVNNGYKRIFTQLNLGGESPLYAKSDRRYREADAALLNLIYPAQLKQLKTSDKEKILKIVEKLAGTYGIKRYHKDNYQSANFWFNDIKTDTNVESFSNREKNFLPNTEAQWFFDSWYAISAFIVYKESNDKKYHNQAIKYMNRSLAQITGEDTIAANGRLVSPDNIPESYNFLYVNGKYKVVPSPIIPLNWAKGTMTIMFKYAKNCADE